MRSASLTKSKPKDVLYDVIVVGLGGVGSFALRSLARGKPGRTSAKVLGLERFHIAHENGSSHGGTRLFRHAYFEHPSYVPLCLKSTETFRELSDWKLSQKHEQAIKTNNFTGNIKKPSPPLLETCGVLVVSDGGASGKYELIKRCAESSRIFGIPTVEMDTTALNKEYKNSFAVPKDNDNYKGLLEPGAGFVRPELAMQYAIDDALSNGAEIREGVAVESILRESEEEPPTYKVEASDGTVYRTKGVIVSAGAWASNLLPELEDHLTVTRQVQAWFEVDENSATQLPLVGWFLDRAEDTLPIYGIPADPFSEHPLQAKIAIHGRTEVFDRETWETSNSDGSTQRRPSVTQEELNELKDLVKDWIPGAAEGIVRSKACMYTMTPDEHFIVDKREEDGNKSNVWYAAGLSGHGFKMTPALGEALSDLVISGETNLPVGFLRKDRFEAQDDNPMNT